MGTPKTQDKVGKLPPGGVTLSKLFLFFCLILNGGNPYAADIDRGGSVTSSQADPVPLTRLHDEAGASKYPALRVFLRLKIAAYLRSNPSDSLKLESVARLALEDIRTHENEIPAPYRELFRKDLLVQLRAHSPAAAAELSKDYEPDRRTEIQAATSLLGQENGVPKALEIVRYIISGGKDLDPSMVFFLRRLDKVDRAETHNVLGAIMSVEESRPGSISAANLFTLEHLFIREQTPQALQRRYLAVLINRAGGAEANPASMVDIYTTLTAALPEVQKQLPDLYSLAAARLANLEDRMPRATLERLAVENRVGQSTDPLGQLIAEAEAAKDQTLKDELLVKAARLALEKGEAWTAIELVVRLKPDNYHSRVWRDEFIAVAVGRALEKGDTRTAWYGIEQINSPSSRSSALQKAALYFQASGDAAGARGALDSSFKLIKDLESDADKAAALLDLSGCFMKVDEVKAEDVMRAAVKYINRAYGGERGLGTAADSCAGDAESKIKIAYRIVSAFQTLGSVDGLRAREVAKDIKILELRVAAELGTYGGPPATDKNGQAVASN